MWFVLRFLPWGAEFLGKLYQPPTHLSVDPLGGNYSIALLDCMISHGITLSNYKWCNTLLQTVQRLSVKAIAIAVE